ncbi:acetylesterase [Actinotalea solisilvae]|uniref:acetylesterase n=1 Tax=Actinotalea solisilvae TaxID=2072922 RepID=UPI0018F12D50|nr:acetylesterase [Actinotalea solisilvae]
MSLTPPAVTGGAYAHLGRFSDWVAASPAPVARAQRREPSALRPLVHGALAVPADPGEEQPADVRSGRRWTRDGVAGEELSWSVGHGPRTHAWLLRPAGVEGALPGVLALHGHDGYKHAGKEKVADGPHGPTPVLAALRAGLYGGRALADDLARAGLAVLVHDAFTWGSRRFELEEMPERLVAAGRATSSAPSPDDVPGEVPADVALYNAAAWHHEHLVEKYCRLLGTTFAAQVAREDRVALAVLRGRPDVADAVGCVGLSGGGARSVLLRATARVEAAVVVGMMSTYAALLDHSVVDHTWMLFPDRLAPAVDWPDVAASGAPAPLLVQWTTDDALFPVEGARAADRRLREVYAGAGAPDAYVGREHPGPHWFGPAMQDEATAWLRERLAP